jgi:hypothetical protein
MEKQDKNRNHSGEMDEQPQGFVASLESLSNNLLDFVMNDEPDTKQEDQLQ